MKELTSGKPIKLIIGFALPVLLGLAFQQAYTLTDTIIIGRQLGKNSLAAVGSTASVVSLMFNIINGLVKLRDSHCEELRRRRPRRNAPFHRPHDHIFGGGDCAHNRGYLDFY